MVQFQTLPCIGDDLPSRSGPSRGLLRRRPTRAVGRHGGVPRPAAAAAAAARQPHGPLAEDI